MIGTGALRTVALGMLVLQMAWLLAVPPFRGMDEWDHAYRAAAVAEGQWRASPEAATRGTGALVAVPRDIVVAAQSECARLPYTGEAECQGVELDDGMVQVASGAGRYHPLFYAVTGYLSLPFEGVARLYGMRAVATAACFGLFLLALGALRRWATGTGVWIGLAVALTPTAAYSTTVMAPNGIEMMAALALWASLIGLAVATDSSRDSYYLGVVVVAAPLLVTVRSLGSLWLLLILAATLLAFPVRRERILALLRRRVGLAAVVAVAVAVGGSVWWTVSQSALELGHQEGASPTWSGRLAETASQFPAWLMQAIGVFPYRDQPTSPYVYVCWLLLGGALIGAGLRRGSGRLRWAIALGLVVTITVPFLITVTTIDSYGPAWQGRYGLPFWFGIVLLAGHALDRADYRVGARAWGPGLLLFVAGSILGPLGVLRSERTNSPWAGTAGWPAPHPVVLVGVLVLATAAIWMAVVRSPHERAYEGSAR